MGSYGFAAEVQDKTLRNGRCRVRLTTLEAVFGQERVPVDTGQPITVTLTDGRDCSSWLVQLTMDGQDRYAVSGLKPWLAHSQARVGDTLIIEANGSGHLASLARKVTAAANGATAGQEADFQQSTAQRVEVNSAGSAPPLGADAQSASLPVAAAAASDPPAQEPPQGGQQEEHLARRDGHSDAPRRTGADLAPGMGPAAPDPAARSGMVTGFTTGQARMSAAAADRSTIPPAAAAAIPMLQQPIQGLGQLTQAGGGGGGGGGSNTSGTDARLARGHLPGYPLRLMDVNQRRPGDSNQGSPTCASGTQGTQAWHDRVLLGEGVERGEAAADQLVNTGVAAGIGHRWAPATVEVSAAAVKGLPLGGCCYALPARGPGADMRRPRDPRGAGTPAGQGPLWAGSLLWPPEARFRGTLPNAGGGGSSGGGGGGGGGSGGGGGDERNSSGGLPTQGVAWNVHGGESPPACQAPEPDAVGLASGGEPLAATGAAAHAMPAGGIGLAGAAGTNGGMSRLGREGAYGAGGSAGATGRLSSGAVQGGARGGGDALRSGSGQPGGVPAGSGGMAVRAMYRKSAVELTRGTAFALWPGIVQGMPVNEAQQVMLYVRCDRARVHVGQELGQLRAHTVKLIRNTGPRFRLTGVAVAAKELRLSGTVAVGLRRLPCGGLLLERWRQEEEQGQGCGQRQRRLYRQQQQVSGEGTGTESSGGAAEAEEQEEEQEHQRTKQLKRLQQVSALAAPRSAAGGYDEADSGADSGTEDLEYGGALPKRRRLLGSSGTGVGLCSQGRMDAQASARVHRPCDSAGRRPVRSPALGADLQPCHEVRFRRCSLYTSAAATRAMWPQLAEDVKRAAHSSEGAQRDASVCAVLHTSTAAELPSAAAAADLATTQQADGEQLVTKQHTVQLNYSASGKKWYVTQAGDLLAALGLRGEGLLQLRRTPDGRAWAERGPAPAVARAVQQPSSRRAAPSALAAVAPATDTHGIGTRHPVGFTYTHSPCAPPARSPNAPYPACRSPAATSDTTAATATPTAIGPLCVSGGSLHLDRPTVAALWPECVDMPVGTQQLVRMRAVAEPGAGGNSGAAAAAGSIAVARCSVTHYGSQLVRLADDVWHLVCTQSLLRELRLGEGDWVQLVPLEGAVVGVRRAGEGPRAAGRGGMIGTCHT